MDDRSLLGGSNGGGFAKDPPYFVVSAYAKNAVYDQYGTRVSNYLSGVDYSEGGNYYFAWISSDASKIVFAQSSLRTLDDPALFFMTAVSSALPTDSAPVGEGGSSGQQPPQQSCPPTCGGQVVPSGQPPPQPSSFPLDQYCPPTCPGPPAPGTSSRP